MCCKTLFWAKYALWMLVVLIFVRGGKDMLIEK